MKRVFNYVKKINSLFDNKEHISQFDRVIFRNDDVSYDSNLDHFKEFCKAFHEAGFIQLHGITLFGRTNCRYVIDGVPFLYDTIKPDDIYDYELCKSVSVDFIGDNKELIDYINSIPDEIALHGLYHSDYSKMSYEQQCIDIEKGLTLLHELFPLKEVKVFIAPFNHYNDDTKLACEKYGLRLSALEGEHLEEMIADGNKPIVDKELYRYHHHRFYPETTFFYYDLSIEKLRSYLQKYSYTCDVSKHSTMPSTELLQACVRKNNAQPWYSYAFEEFNNRKHVLSAYEWIKSNVPKDKSILEVACGASGMLFHLDRDGYTDLSGYDNDIKAINAAIEINKCMGKRLDLFVDDVTCPRFERCYDAIVWIDGMYHLENYSLDMFLDAHIRKLNDLGYIVFDMVDEEFNGAPNHESLSQHWTKEGGEQKNKFFIMMSKKQLVKCCRKYNLRLIKQYNIKDIIPRKVYVFQLKQPSICLLCDRPGWAFHNSAVELKKELEDEFNIDIKYVTERPDIDKNKYDLLMIFFWGEKSYLQYHFPKKRIIKEVSSLRWQYDDDYGKLSPKVFVDTYLNDAGTVICTSNKLYEMLQPLCKNLFLCENGFSVELFWNKKKRFGDISFCMAGNTKDPVKGVEDILIPAGEGFDLSIASDIPHNNMCDFYNEHDVYVISSKHEAEPLTLIEAMACGCFPVSTAIGLVPELVKHKENGYIVPERSIDEYKKAFQWCVDNANHVRLMGERNAQYMRDNRNWSKMAEVYRQMFRDCLSRL